METPAETTVVPALDFDAIMAEHLLWITSEGKEGKRANLRGMDLSDIDLSGRQLAEASLRSVILRGANLSGADLRTADLSEAVLDDANLTGALLTGASLARAKLHNANFFGADMVTANLSSVIADGANFSETKLLGATLRDANFRHVDFSRAQMREANLRGATLLEANLTAVDLSAADCRDVNFDRAIFTDAKLNGTNLRGTRFGQVDLNAADFSVALDLSAEAQSQSLLSERNKMQEEQAMLATRRLEMDEKEVGLNEREQALQDLIDGALNSGEESLAVIKNGINRFTALLVIWLIVFALVLTVLAARIADIGMERVGLVAALAGVIISLALLSVTRSLSIARRLKVLHKTYSQWGQQLLVAKKAALPHERSKPVQSEPLLVRPPVKPPSDEQWGTEEDDN